MMRKRRLVMLKKLMLVLSMFSLAGYGAVALSNVKIQQRYPWNGKVDISFKFNSTRSNNTVLVTQAPPRGASAHARYLSASTISARQDGHTVLRTRLVFAVSPRSALSHSNLATHFRGKFRNEFLRCSMLNFGRFDTKPR